MKKVLLRKIKAEIKRREKLGEWVNRSQLAMKANVSDKTVYNCLNGVASIDSMIKVFEALGLEVN